MYRETTTTAIHGGARSVRSALSGFQRHSPLAIVSITVIFRLAERERRIPTLKARASPPKARVAPESPLGSPGERQIDLTCAVFPPPYPPFSFSRARDVLFRSIVPCSRRECVPIKKVFPRNGERRGRRTPFIV